MHVRVCMHACVCACMRFIKLICIYHLAVLKWARANGCPWSAKTITEAAVHEELEVVQWARENGCPEPTPIPQKEGQGKEEKEKCEIM